MVKRSAERIDVRQSKHVERYKPVRRPNIGTVNAIEPHFGHAAGDSIAGKRSAYSVVVTVDLLSDGEEAFAAFVSHRLKTTLKDERCVA